MATVDELKKLSPEERIKRLEELEEERKKEIAEAEELIKQTVIELANAEEKKKIPIPQARATDILSALTTAEEKQLVATHHLLASETATPTAATTTATQQQKSLEEVAAESPTPPQQQQAQQKFQKPEYALGTEQQRSAFGDYLSKSQQTVTAGTPPGSGELEKITEIYKERAVTGAEGEDAQQKYFGTRQQVTGGYELRKREEEDRKERTEYRRRGGPA